MSPLTGENAFHLLMVRSPTWYEQSMDVAGNKNEYINFIIYSKEHPPPPVFFGCFELLSVELFGGSWKTSFLSSIFLFLFLSRNSEARVSNTSSMLEPSFTLVLIKFTFNRFASSSASSLFIY